MRRCHRRARIAIRYFSRRPSILVSIPRVAAARERAPSLPNGIPKWIRRQPAMREIPDPARLLCGSGRHPQQLTDPFALLDTPPGLEHDSLYAVGAVEIDRAAEKPEPQLAHAGARGARDREGSD